MQDSVTVHLESCPRCEYRGKWKYYDGALGYESAVCPRCLLDANDIRVTVPGEDLSIDNGSPCLKSTE